jgi:hypothetical protein
MESHPSLCNNQPQVNPPAPYQSNGSASRGQKLTDPAGRPPASPLTVDGQVFRGDGFGSYDICALDAELGQFACVVTGGGDGFTIDAGPQYSAADIFTVTVSPPAMDGEGVPAVTTITVSNAPVDGTADAVSAAELGCYSCTVCAFTPDGGPWGSSFVATLGWGAGPDPNDLPGKRPGGGTPFPGGPGGDRPPRPFLTPTHTCFPKWRFARNVLRLLT